MTLSRFPTILTLAGIALLAMCVATLAAAEKEYPGYNCAVTPPDGWEDVLANVDQKGPIAAFAPPDRTRIVEIVIGTEQPLTHEIDGDFVSKLEKRMEAHPDDKRLSARVLSFRGIKIYERISETTIGGKAVSKMVRIVPTSERTYFLHAYRNDGGEVTLDPLVQSFMESFRLLTPAALAAAAPPASPQDKEIQDAFKRGQAAAPLFDFLLISGVVAGVIVFLVKRNRKRKAPLAGPPPPPPPLPQTPPSLPQTKAFQPQPRSSAPASPPPSPEPPAPQAEPAPPAPIPPPPTVAPAPSSVIRPRQRHMRE